LSGFGLTHSDRLLQIRRAIRSDAVPAVRPGSAGCWNGRHRRL